LVRQPLLEPRRIDLVALSPLGFDNRNAGAEADVTMLPPRFRRVNFRWQPAPHRARG